MSRIRDIIKYVYYRIKEIICVNYLKRYFCALKYRKKFKNHSKTIYIVTTPEYGNLGDHAIAQAEIDLAKKNFNDYEIFEIPDSMYDTYIYCLRFYTTPKDMIWFIGGGNFGIMYPQSEYNRRTVIKKCKRCKIIMFPQSNTTSNSIFDQLELKKSIKIYSKNPNVSLIARDKNTFLHIKNNFIKNNVYYAPDVVLTWDISSYIQTSKQNINNKKLNKKVLFCIRKDRESSIDKNIINSFITSMQSMNYDIEFFDTETYRNISIGDRKNELVSLLNKLKEADYVITDRLHGMVLTCLVGKPCLAFDNSTKKISGLVKWIKNKEIIMYDKTDSVKNQIKNLVSQTDFMYDFKENYNILFSILKEIEKK
ncbi:polysaccharide pyruvyl transferase family protein [Turicibacter sanguinis]|uniref:polysaccharide pyruvyl transferase family protein n=1 Tax=Turicibacter sanguinis TaxID=154288 RepID=UPI00325AC7B2